MLAILEFKEVKFEKDTIKENNWICVESGYISYQYKGEVKTIVIPLGFDCDLSSIPKYFEDIFPKELIATAQMGFFHDFKYREMPKLKGDTRKEADLMYKEGLKNLSFDEYVPVAKFKVKAILKWFLYLFLKKILRRTNSEIFYLVVRLFGAKYYL